MPAAGQSVSAVRQPDGSVRLENAFYSCLLDASKGYSITELVDKERDRRLEAVFGDVILKRKTVWTGQGFPDPGSSNQSQAKVNCRIERKGDAAAGAVLGWSCVEGVVDVVITARAGSRIIEYDVRVQTAAPLDYVTVRLAATAYGSKAVIMPDGRRLSGRAPDVQRYREAPCRVVGFDPEGGETLGLLTDPATRGTVGVYLCHKPEGTTAQAFAAQYYSRYLAHKPAGRGVTFNLGLLVGGGRDVLEELQPYTTEPEGPAEIVRWWPDKLILPRGGVGTGTAVLRNNLSKPQRYTVSLTRITGIDEQDAVWREDVTLGGGEQREVAVRWEGGEREYGRELRLGLLRDGRVVDEQAEYAALGDDYPRLSQLTVVNPGWFCREGHQNWMIPLMREGYTGILEYYDWAPDSQYDIAPEAERWEPHTDSQFGYRASISSRFLKDTIALAHAQGIKVVAELNGMAGLPRAMEHPDELMYTEDGQPWIYSRRVYHDGSEYATIFRDYFVKERVLAWADAMGASSKVFGWDGVRFDTTLRPTLYTGDPYYQYHNIGDSVTYTFDGVRRDEHYDDPDTWGANIIRLWRERTRQHKPGFRYLTNFCHNRGLQAMFPKYTAAAAADGGWLLQEFLIYTSREYDSISGWVKELRAEGENLRALGGEPAAGDMAWGPSGYSSMMQWTAFACGYHLMAWTGTRHRPDDNTWKQNRFALRYAEYFYAPDMQWLPADQTRVVVEPDDGILWQDFVYKRVLGDGRTQYIVDLVNLPEDSGRMYMNHAPASLKTSVQVSLHAGAEEKRVNAYALLPDPEPHAVALKLSGNEGTRSVSIDELHEFAMVVFEVKP